MTKEEALKNVIDNPMSAEAWQNCGKACGWENSERYWSVEQEVKITLLDSWENTAMTFHHKNLTEGWNQAVAYLQEVTK